jgi:hypothetical protein
MLNVYTLLLIELPTPVSGVRERNSLPYDYMLLFKECIRSPLVVNQRTDNTKDKGKTMI